MPYPTIGPTSQPKRITTQSTLPRPKRKPKSTIRFPINWDIGVILASIYFASIFILLIYFIQTHKSYNYFQSHGILYRTNLSTNISEYQWNNKWQPVISIAPLPSNPYEHLTVDEKKAIFYDKFPQYKPKLKNRLTPNQPETTNLGRESK